MSTGHASLRMAIDKWFDHTQPLRVRRIQVESPNTGRCVRVEGIEAPAPVTIYFFEHEGGDWRVYPAIRRPTSMGAFTCLSERALRLSLS
ncbi:hypothetical protein [Caballeronia sp. ATUFL_M2_KS44]|uniref:hypothetical protein n=1 Tax=Caballeronia sp. ATUFL_M2_KS44 TaxID=2921767 RepID=UPI002028D79E|nr:hypothetical protein [Caballeronia sp. ATUFL_M2_KS44]